MNDIKNISIEGRLILKPLLCYEPICVNCAVYENNCLNDLHKMRVQKDIIFIFNGYKITILRGFLFDGASIPQFFWSTTGSPFDFRFLIAALIHDALYASESLARKEADQIFRLLLKFYKVDIYTRNKMYLAVRIGGGKVWKNHTQESITEARQFIKIEKL
ncbi:DUF1353 domain-containing protein [Lentisphaerota bacterium WC36G]|nr:DUF1353 domain-containing protein [Lentisphaerae bacterium WC36]